MRKRRLRVLIAGTLIYLVIAYHADLSSLADQEAVLPAQNEYKVEAFSDRQPWINTQEDGLEAHEAISPLPEEAPPYGINEEDPAKEQAASWEKLPDGFVYLREAIPGAQFDVRYATSHNFTGQVVEGYESDHISCTVESSEALKKAATLVNKQGYGFLIYDAYRPKQAVDFFIQWGQTPENNQTKEEFYPDLAKKDLFKLGYLARRSAHSRGSTIDLTLFSLDTGEPLDMGSPYDFLGPVSHHGTALITKEQTRNRDILREAMKASGFKELKTEWWHYELSSEPYPGTFFDFVIR